jgi:hypothetical protein
LNNKTIYKLINWTIASVFGFIFLYTGLIAKKPEMQINCYYDKKFGVPCPTCGLTRSFIMIIDGNINGAKQMNKNSIPIFCFFSFQLFMRIGSGIYLSKVKQFSVNKLLTFDTIISTITLTLAVHNIILDIYRR